MKSKTIISPSQHDIPQSYLDCHGKTDTLEVNGHECKDGEEAKQRMEKITKEKEAELDDALKKEADRHSYCQK